MRLRPLLDADSSTRSWLLWCERTNEAVLLDPVQEHVDRDASAIEELGLTLVATVENHVQADHVTGAAGLRARLGSEANVPGKAGVAGADRGVAEGDRVVFGEEALLVRETPGHTDHCVTYVLQSGGAAFTCDTLLIRGNGRTDFQSGDARALYRSIRDKVLSLPDETVLYPAHDYKGRLWTTVREERAYNLRIADGVTEQQFVDTMAALDLAYPRHMDVAVPANLRLGVREAPWDQEAVDARGVAHVDVAWLAAHRDRVRVVDVREEDELRGPLGRLDGITHVPLARVAEVARRWDPTRPLAMVCRSGGRSDRAAEALARMGFAQVANVDGGMLAWNAQA